jgi:hypothetical protein
MIAPVRPNDPALAAAYATPPNTLRTSRYRILIDGRLLVAKINRCPDGFVRWTLQGTDPRHCRTDSLAKFAVCAEAEVDVDALGEQTFAHPL